MPEKTHLFMCNNGIQCAQEDKAEPPDKPSQGFGILDDNGFRLQVQKLAKRSLLP